MLKNLIALHLDVMKAIVDHLMGRWVEGASPGDIQETPEVPVGIDPGGKDLSLPFSGVLAQHDRPSPVSKEHTGISILKIGPVGDDLSSHHQGMLMGAVLHKLLGHRQAVNKSRAGGIHIKCHGLFSPDPVLDYTALGWSGHIRRRGPDNNQVQFLRGQARHFQGFFRGRDNDIAQGLPGQNHPSFFNSGATENPFVGSIYQAFKIGIGDYPFRNEGSCSLDAHFYQLNILLLISLKWFENYYHLNNYLSNYFFLPPKGTGWEKVPTEQK
jgi:hypothetical protein